MIEDEEKASAETETSKDMIPNFSIEELDWQWN